MTNRKKQVGQPPGPEHELHRKGDQHTAAARLEAAATTYPMDHEAPKKPGRNSPWQAEPDCRIATRGY